MLLFCFAILRCFKSRLILKNMFHLLECLGKTMEFVAQRLFQLVGWIPHQNLDLQVTVAKVEDGKMGVISLWKMRLKDKDGCIDVDVSKNSGKTPQIIHFNRVFHDFHHPFWGTPIFGNTHVLEKGRVKTFFLNAVLCKMSHPFWMKILDTSHSYAPVCSRRFDNCSCAILTAVVYP